MIKWIVLFQIAATAACFALAYLISYVGHSHEAGQWTLLLYVCGWTFAAVTALTGIGWGAYVLLR